ncbi:SIS domain-containing protein [bacterium]|nr:SIS domain-containing protein [bacterium]
MSYMLEEIHAQPDVVSKLANEERGAASNLAAEIKQRGIDLILIAARGTSDHAAIYGKYLIEINNGIPVALADCSAFTLYQAKMKLDRALVIGISQSGEATDVAEYLEESRKMGALTLSITNEPGSKLTQIADHTLLCHAGKELGVAATKTYTSTLAVLYLLSAALCGDSSCMDRLHVCADAMRQVLTIEDYISDHAERYRYMQDGYVIARGFNYCTALEASLKLAETCYVGMLGYSAADFLHGPIAAVHENEACFLIAPPGKTFDGMKDIAARLKDRKAEMVVISSEDDILQMATRQFKIPVQIEEELSPLLYILPSQMLAYYLANAKGYDPDRPRGLSKVTLTM